MASYPHAISDQIPSLYKRKPKYAKPRAYMTHNRPPITPGTMVIFLAGIFKGKRVVFLKKLRSGLLLVAGPNFNNGVPFRRVNKSHVTSTSTKIDVSKYNVDKIDDNYFSKKSQKKNNKGEGEFFEAEKEEKNVLSQEKKDDQKSEDPALLKG